MSHRFSLSQVVPDKSFAFNLPITARHRNVRHNMLNVIIENPRYSVGGYGIASVGEDEMRHAIALSIFATLASVVSVSAMPHCGDRDTVVSALGDLYGEHHVASGLQSSTGLLEIWSSGDGGSWTILLTRPDGVTCVMASGTYWLYIGDDAGVADESA